MEGAGGVKYLGLGGWGGGGEGWMYDDDGGSGKWMRMRGRYKSGEFSLESVRFDIYVMMYKRDKAS